MRAIKDYIPGVEAKLVTWTGEFLATLQSKPAGSLPISADRIAEYVTSRNRFLEYYSLANNPNTRNKPNINQKNEYKKTLIRSTRSIVDVLQSWPQMNNTLRDELGIPRRGTKPTPMPVPAKSPVIAIVSVVGRTVTMDIMQGKSQKGKPRGAVGANIFVAYGDEHPEGAIGWTLLTGTGKTRLTVRLGNTDAAETVWINACWLNGRRESGPSMDEPVCVNLPAAAAQIREAGTLKIRRAA